MKRLIYHANTAQFVTAKRSGQKRMIALTDTSGNVESKQKKTPQNWAQYQRRLLIWKEQPHDSRDYKVNLLVVCWFEWEADKQTIKIRISYTIVDWSNFCSGQWVFGGIQEDSRNSFIFAVDDRTEKTLIPLKKWIKTGSIIIYDCWKSYTNI